MSLSEQVKFAVVRERKNDETLQRISEKFHIPQSHVANLLNGKRSFEGITLGTFDRMFPRATVDLDGRSSIIASRVASPGDGNITYSSGDRSEALRSAIIAAIIDLDITPEILAKVLKAVKHTEV